MAWGIRLLGKDLVSFGAVDPFFSALRVSARPLDLTNGGTYRVAVRTGTLAATLAANAIIGALRWDSSTHKCILHRLRAQIFANLAFTAAFNDMSMYAIGTRGYTASDTAGAGNTALTMTGNNAKVATAHQTSQFSTQGDIRIAGTAAMTGGTGTDDAHPFAYSQVGKPNVVNVAAGTEYVAAQPVCTLDYEPDMGDGVHPHLFAADEGFRLRNGPVVWPAAGTGIMVMQISWSEVENARFPG